MECFEKDKMTEISFDEIKKLELEILKYVANFCDTHNLKYFLAYGTLIGAVRHKGFIPWDDDIDIQMPRDDYNKLIEIFNKEKDVEYLDLIDPNDSKSRHSIVKIIDNRTVKIEKNVDYKNGNLGIDIDIFPLDGQPESEEEYSKWYDKLQATYRKYNVKISKISGSIKGRIYRIIIKSFNSKRSLKNRVNKLHSMYPYEGSKYIGAIESSFNSKNNRIERGKYDSFVFLDFEGQKFKAPAGYHEILTKMYGNYMELPPVEKQVTHHSNKNYWKGKM